MKETGAPITNSGTTESAVKRVCVRCGVSEIFHAMIPRMCEATSWTKHHDFIPEPICQCGHGQQSHGYGMGGAFCSVGFCHGKTHVTRYTASTPNEKSDQTPTV